MAGERVIIELADSTLTRCPWEVIGMDAPPECDRQCIEKADDSGRLTECWQAMCDKVERLLDGGEVPGETGRGTQRGAEQAQQRSV